MDFYATLPPGIEDVAAEELAKLGAKVTEIRKGKGRLFFKAPIKSVAELNIWLRCVERVVLLLHRGYFSTLENIYSTVKSLDFKFMRGKSFAIRSMRAGSHDFTSMDVARVAGQAVIDSFMESYGERLKVNLNEPDVIVRAEVVDDELFIGIDTTGDDALHKRWWRVYNHPAHLNSTIACAMLRLAGWERRKRLVDPMCGSGTIPIEAALMAFNIPPGKNREFAFQKLCDLKISADDGGVEGREDVEITGIEKFRKHLEGAKMNAEKAGVLDAITFLQGDATKLEGSYDCIVTNPPYGLRIARKGVIKKLYEGLCKAMKSCMDENGRGVVITAEYGIMKRSAEKVGLLVEHERFVRYGGLITKVFVFRV